MNIKKLLQKIKVTKAYQIYFVESVKEKSLLVVLRNVLVFGLFGIVFFGGAAFMDEFPELNQLNSVKGRIIELSSGGRRTSPKLIMDIDGSRQGFVLYLDEDHSLVNEKYANKDVILWYGESYTVWPIITEKYVAHVVYGEEIILKDYTEYRGQRIEYNFTMKKITLFSALMLGFILRRIWKKHSKNIDF